RQEEPCRRARRTPGRRAPDYKPALACAEQKPGYAEKDDDGYYPVYCLPLKKLAADKGYADYSYSKPDERLCFRRENPKLIEIFRRTNRACYSVPVSGPTRPRRFCHAVVLRCAPLRCKAGSRIHRLARCIWPFGRRSSRGRLRKDK